MRLSRNDLLPFSISLLFALLLCLGPLTANKARGQGLTIASQAGRSVTVNVDCHGSCTGLQLDWGDGSGRINIMNSGSSSHAYARDGRYCIMLWCSGEPCNTCSAGHCNSPTCREIVISQATDTVNPRIHITRPTTAPAYTASHPRVNLAGTASDNVGIRQVTWRNSAGGSGRATGTTSWSIPGIILAGGTNIISVTATDTSGNRATDTISVSFQEAEDSGTGTSTTSASSFTIEVIPAELFLSLQQSNLLALTYQAHSTAMAAFTLSSDHGELVDEQGRLLYRVPSPVSLSLVRGTGIQAESLLLPSAIVDKVLQDTRHHYFYQRTFAYNGLERTTRVGLQFTPSFTIQSLPSMFSLVPGQNLPLVLSYQAAAPGPYSFTVRSERGEVVNGNGRVLYRVNHPLSLPIVQGTGRAMENVTVPPGVISKALQENSNPLYYRRLFTFSGVHGETRTTLMILPSSMGGFMLTRMELSFVLNDQVTGTPGRVTVSPNYKGLKARAILSYNGGGLLRGQWKVDGQVIGFVTKQLVAGLGDVELESPKVPGFPTYATGTHKVELEILDPRPLFAEPLVYYFVSLKKEEQTIHLLAPAEGSVVNLDSDIRFRWQTPARLGRDSLRLQIFSPRPPAGFDSKSSGADADDHAWLSVLLRPDSDQYLLPLFYKKEVRPSITYHWQVSALKKNRVTGFSARRAITFAPGQESGQVLFEDLAQGKAEGDEGSVAANLKNESDRDRHNVRVEFVLDDQVVDVSFLPLLAAGSSVPVAGGYPLQGGPGGHIVLRALEKGEVLATAEIGVGEGAAKAPPRAASCGDGQFVIGEFCLEVDGEIVDSGPISGNGTIHVPFMDKDIPVEFSDLGLNEDRNAVTTGTIQVDGTPTIWDGNLPDREWATIHVTTITFGPKEATAATGLIIAPPYMAAEISVSADKAAFHPEGISGQLVLAGPTGEQQLYTPLDGFTIKLDTGSRVTLENNNLASSSFTGRLHLPATVLDAELAFNHLALEDDGGLYGTSSLDTTTLIAATNIGLAGNMTIDLTAASSPDDTSEADQWMGVWLDKGTISLESLFTGVEIGDVAGLYIDSGLKGTVDRDLETIARKFGSGDLQFTVSLTHLLLQGNNHSSTSNSLSGTLSINASVPLAGSLFDADLDITADGIGDNLNLGDDKQVDIPNLATVTFKGDSSLAFAGKKVSVRLHTEFTSLGRLAHSVSGRIDTVLYMDSEGTVGLQQVSGNTVTVEHWIDLGGNSLDFADLFSLSLQQFGFGFDDNGFAIGIGGGLQISDKFLEADAKAGIYLNSGDLWCDEVEVGLETESVSFEGTVAFVDDREKEEFRGDMKLSVIDTLNVDSTLIVGRTKQQGDYYYFYIDGHLDMPPPGMQLTPYPIAFYGFGGGLYYNMCPSLDVQGERTYAPAQGAYGLKAATTLGTSFDKGYTFHARPEMELSIQTRDGTNSCNSDGTGFNLSLHGPIYLLCDLTGEKDYRRFETFTEFGCSGGSGCAFSSRISVDDFAVLEPGESQLLGIDADMDMKLGAGEWYFRMGTRDSPSTVRILPNYAEDMLHADGYLDIDDTGIRAGALVELDSGDQTLLIFYGRVWGGLSSDFEVSFDPGFVYAEFAVWMGVEAGLDLDSLGKIEIFSAEARLDGGVRTPRPTRLWVHGRLEYSVLDGAASGDWEMTFVWGDPLPEHGVTTSTWPVFDSLEPEDGSMDVPVGSLIRVNLTTPVSSNAWGDYPENRSLGTGRCGSHLQRFPDAEGNTYELAALLDDFWLEEGRGGTVGRVTGTIEWNDSCTSFTFVPDHLLDAGHWYTVHFRARARGSMIQGFTSREDKTFLFHTGGLPADLKMMVSSSYPENGQKYCFRDYPVEIRFSRGLEFLRNDLVTGRLEKADGSEVAGSYTLSADGRTARFTPSAPLAADTSYTFRLVRINDSSPTTGMTPAATTDGTLNLAATGMARDTAIQGSINQLVAGQREAMGANAATASATVVGSEPVTETGAPHALPGDITDALGEEWLRIKFRTGRFHTLAELVSDETSRLTIMPAGQLCSSAELSAMQQNPTFPVRMTLAEPVNWSQVKLTVHSGTQRAQSNLCRAVLGPRNAAVPPGGASTYSMDTGPGYAGADDMGPGDTSGQGNGASAPSPDTGTCHSREAERQIFLSAAPTLVRTMVGSTGSDDSRYGFRLSIHPDRYRVERLDGDCEAVNRLWDHEFETGARTVSPLCLQALVGQLSDAVRLDIRSTVLETDHKTLSLDVPDIPDSWEACGNMSGDMPTYSQDGNARDAEIFVHDSGMPRVPQNGMEILGPGLFQGVVDSILPGLELDRGVRDRFAGAVEDFDRLRQEYSSLSQEGELEDRYADLAGQYSDLRDKFMALGHVDNVRAAEDFSGLVDSLAELNVGFQSLNNGDDLF